MSTFEVTIEKITVFPHPNADRLALARVGLYNIVVGKDNWNTGDKVLYIPEFAVLPQELIIALGLEGKLAGSKKDRVKPIALRGELSQGLVAPLSLLPEGSLETIGEDGDFAEVLGITKWQPIVPEGMSGDRVGNAELIPWIDIENLKKYPDLFEEGETVIVDEKIHGTASLYTFLNPGADDAEVLVSSKGLGSGHLVLKESDKVLYWNILKAHNIEGLANNIAEVYADILGDKDATGKTVTPAVINKVAVFGETFGKNVQDLHYGRDDKRGFLVFDAFLEYTNAEGIFGYWLDPNELTLSTAEVGLDTPPRLYEGPFSLEIVSGLAYGPEQVSGTEAHIREGVVIRPANRQKDYYGGAKKIAKYVSDDYLTRKDATEYQ